MSKKNEKQENIMEQTEDVTQYGEFISSYFAWLTLDKQKQNARELEQMTKKKK